MRTSDIMLHYYNLSAFGCGSCCMECDHEGKPCFKWCYSKGKVLLYNVKIHSDFLNGVVR